MDLNPMTKLNLCVLLAVTAGFFGYIWMRLAIIMCYFLIAALANQSKKFVSSYLKVGAILILFIFTIRAMFLPGNSVLFQWWIIRVTTESVLAGLSFSLLVVEICGSVMLFYAITPMKDLMYSIEMMGVSHSVSYIFLAAMQTISDLGKAARTIMDSQSARGVETEGNLKVRFMAFIPILGPLLLGAISTTEEKTLAMETRAFSTSEETTHVYELRKTPLFEKITCCVLNISLVAAILWRVLI
jgi:energy-coupling factor transport system permease protein